MRSPPCARKSVAGWQHVRTQVLEVVVLGNEVVEVVPAVRAVLSNTIIIIKPIERTMPAMPCFENMPSPRCPKVLLPCCLFVLEKRS